MYFRSCFEKVKAPEGNSSSAGAAERFSLHIVEKVPKGSFPGSRCGRLNNDPRGKAWAIDQA